MVGLAGKCYQIWRERSNADKQRMRSRALAATMRAASFSSTTESAAQLADEALAWLPPAPGQAALDLGTGTGCLAGLLRTARPDLVVTGIDFALANIAAARAQRSDIRFVCADYLTWQGDAFHLIVAESVLHLIESPVAQLAARLAADLVADGVLVATVPDDALRNQGLLLLRRIYRLLPKAADRFALALAIRLYPGWSRQALTDRLPYLRLLPRLFGPAEQAAFAAAGLHLEAKRAWPSPSLAKPRHLLMVWRRV
jgi:trans-aconitate methyltransferase